MSVAMAAAAAAMSEVLDTSIGMKEQKTLMVHLALLEAGVVRGGPDRW
jgi:hypothetical protein